MQIIAFPTERILAAQSAEPAPRGTKFPGAATTRQRAARNVEPRDSFVAHAARSGRDSRNRSSFMRQQLRQCLMTFAILGCTTVVAAAQAPAQQTPTPRPSAPSAQTPTLGAPVAEQKLNLTQQQKQMIMQGLTNQQAESSAGGPEVRVGAKLPNTLLPHPMPSNVAAQVPDTKNFEFVKLSDKILLVDPANKMIAEIVPMSSTTGAGTPASPANPVAPAPRP
jgi:hypothetical protein